VSADRWWTRTAKVERPIGAENFRFSSKVENPSIMGRVQTYTAFLH